MEDSSEMENSCGLRRRSVGIDPTVTNIPLNLEVGYKVADGVIKGTPSPSTTKVYFGDDDTKPSSSLVEFRKKQQSFEIHIEDCDEEELSGASSDEDRSRPETPINVMQFPDCGGNIVYKEQPAGENFLRVGERDQECLTDVSEGESENEDEENAALPKRTVIKRVPH